MRLADELPKGDATAEQSAPGVGELHLVVEFGKLVRTADAK
jgi:hypothetical protein